MDQLDRVTYLVVDDTWDSVVEACHHSDDVHNHSAALDTNAAVVVVVVFEACRAVDHEDTNSLVDLSMDRRSSLDSAVVVVVASCLVEVDKVDAAVETSLVGVSMLCSSVRSKDSHAEKSMRSSDPTETEMELNRLVNVVVAMME